MVESVARQQDVPPRVLWALIRAESNSRTQDGARPWPWVINHRGTALFFQTETAAIAHARTLLANGDRMFDVGLGQLNWRWHAERFDDQIANAFDPRTNLTAAAAILREQYSRDVCRGCVEAVGCYHRPSRTAKDREIADRYAARVLDHWSTEPWN